MEFQQSSHVIMPSSTSAFKLVSKDVLPNEDSDQAIQCEIIYYSDFEMNLEDWRSEVEYFQVFSNELLKLLGILIDN